MKKKTSTEIHKLVIGTFETEIGQRLLSHLEDVYVDRDMYAQGLTLDQVAFRQGQADIIKQIIKELSDGR